MSSRSPANALPDWAQILLRSLAALVGGYLFSYALTAAVARLLPLEPVDAVIYSSLLAFAVYTLAILWAFAARNLWRAWLPLALAVPLAIIGLGPQWLEYLP